MPVASRVGDILTNETQPIDRIETIPGREHSVIVVVIGSEPYPFISTDTVHINVHNVALPGVEYLRAISQPDEVSRNDIYQDGSYIGTVVYVGKPAPSGGTAYGWRPANNRRYSLTNQVEAIRKLEGFKP